jgi:transcriptional regulator with XRE-family HTH domain
MAGVSRGQLIALENGENISLTFLIKIAKALELTELRIGDLNLRPSPPDLTMLIVAGNAISAARRVVDQATAVSDELASASVSVSALIDRALKPVPETGVEQAVERLASTPVEKQATTRRALRNLAETPDAVVRSARPKSGTVKPAARRRAR